MRSLGAWLAFLALAACGATQHKVIVASGTTTGDDDFAFVVDTAEHHRRLENGARVVLVPDPSTNLVHVLVRVEVGHKEDPAGDGGLAHLVEHLLFELRDAPGAPTLGSQLAEAAIFTNAFTWPDATDYVTIAGADQLARVLELEARRLDLGCRGIDEATLRREREVVKNERRLRGSDLWDRVRPVLFPPGHPYARGEADERALDDVTVDRVCRFIADHYVPERATVVITGGVAVADLDQAIASLAALPARRGAALTAVPDGTPGRWPPAWSRCRCPRGSAARC